MDSRLVIIIILNLFFAQSACGQFYVGEKKIKESKVSKEIRAYIQQNYAGKKIKYYRVTTATDSILYEAKIKTSQGKLTLVFNAANKLVSNDQEIHYLKVPKAMRQPISTSLSKRFDKYKVTYCEYQKLDKQRIVELDVSAKKKNYKFRFKEDGTLIDYREIPQKNLALIFN